MLKSAVFVLMMLSVGGVSHALALSLDEELQLGFKPCSGLTGTPSLADCHDKQYKIADKQLNEQWHRVTKFIKSNDRLSKRQRRKWKKTLLAAQRSWIKFRTADCEAAPYANWGGTIASLNFTSCRLENTILRTYLLKAIADSRTSDPLLGNMLPKAVADCQGKTSVVAQTKCYKRHVKIADGRLVEQLKYVRSLIDEYDHMPQEEQKKWKSLMRSIQKNGRNYRRNDCKAARFAKKGRRSKALVYTLCMLRHSKIHGDMLQQLYGPY